jgi:hypothetical protein
MADLLLHFPMTLLEYVWVKWLVCFVLAFLSDWCFTLYIRRAGEGRAHKAAVWSALIVAFGALNTISYVQHPLLLIPILAGYYAGTYFAVKHDHPKET